MKTFAELIIEEAVRAAFWDKWTKRFLILLATAIGVSLVVIAVKVT